MGRRTFFGWKGILAIVILNAACLLIASVGFVNHFSSKELQKIVDDGIVVEAEIVRLVYDNKSNNHKAGTSTHRLIYRYVSEDGTVYEGDCYQGDYRTEEESYKRIGEKVNIYIGSNKAGKPLSRYVGYGDVDVGWGLVYGSVSLAIMVLMDVGILIFWLCMQTK